jgi:sugar phosphate isomerase/epimerase
VTDTVTASPSVQLYSVRDAIADDLQGAVARVAAIGFRFVEPYGFADRAAEFEQAFRDSGVSAPSGHAPVIDAEDPDRHFEAAARLGIGTLIDPFIPTERWQAADDIARIADRVNELGARAATFGLAFGYHNHNWELANEVDGRPALLSFVDRLDEGIVLEIDTFWASVGGVDTPALLTELGDRVKFIHVKDGPLSLETTTQLPAGQGDVDVVGILAAAPAALRVVEFDAYSGDVFDGLAASFAWLQEHDA